MTPATARLLSLLDSFTRETATAAEFAHGWREFRRSAQSNGERVGGKLADIFDQVFMMLEAYTPDPELREPEDLTDTQLLESVRALVAETGWRGPGADGSRKR
ncbi:colicin immunity domain-containing protein [Streptomyces sp. NPDC053493]|uniref:colicin immunity domain-containing protein n=1 Tax=Streptomyces sp. NPDC053493 TaxID=3365705 RepID=UPI0037D4BD02